MRGLLISLAGMASACTSSLNETSVVEQGACTALEGRTFSAGGAQIVFDIGSTSSSEFSWTHSDVAEAGQVSCNGNAISVTTARRSFRATFDPKTLRLQWAGETYVAQ